MLYSCTVPLLDMMTNRCLQDMIFRKFMIIRFSMESDLCWNSGSTLAWHLINSGCFFKGLHAWWAANCFSIGNFWQTSIGFFCGIVYTVNKYLSFAYLDWPRSTLEISPDPPRFSERFQSGHVAIWINKIIGFVTIEIATHAIQLVAILWLGCYFQHTSPVPCQSKNSSFCNDKRNLPNTNITIQL